MLSKAFLMSNETKNLFHFFASGAKDLIDHHGKIFLGRDTRLESCLV